MQMDAPTTEDEVTKVQQDLSLCWKPCPCNPPRPSNKNTISRDTITRILCFIVLNGYIEKVPRKLQVLLGSGP